MRLRLNWSISLSTIRSIIVVEESGVFSSIVIVILWCVQYWNCLLDMKRPPLPSPWQRSSSRYIIDRHSYFQHNKFKWTLIMVAGYVTVLSIFPTGFAADWIDEDIAESLLPSLHPPDIWSSSGWSHSCL